MPWQIVSKRPSSRMFALPGPPWEDPLGFRIARFKKSLSGLPVSVLPWPPDIVKLRNSGCCSCCRGRDRKSQRLVPMLLFCAFSTVALGLRPSPSLAPSLFVLPVEAWLRSWPLSSSFDWEWLLFGRVLESSLETMAASDQRGFCQLCAIQRLVPHQPSGALEISSPSGSSGLDAVPDRYVAQMTATCLALALSLMGAALVELTPSKPLQLIKKRPSSPFLGVSSPVYRRAALVFVRFGGDLRVWPWCPRCRRWQPPVCSSTETMWPGWIALDSRRLLHEWLPRSRPTSGGPGSGWIPSSPLPPLRVAASQFWSASSSVSMLLLRHSVHGLRMSVCAGVFDHVGQRCLNLQRVWP